MRKNITDFIKKRFSKEESQAYAEKAKQKIDLGMRKMGKEAKETRDMAHSFFRLLEDKLKLKERKDAPSEKEVKEAIEQLKDVGRLSVFTAGIIIPGGAISLIGLEMLARKFGVKGFRITPSAFVKNADWEYAEGFEKKEKVIKNKKRGQISDVKPLDED